MKKTLLSAMMLLGSFGFTQAQTLVDGNQNLNVTFNSSSYCLANCCNGTVADLYYASGGNVQRSTSTFVAGSHKKWVSTATLSGTATPMFLDIYATIGTNCTQARENANIDMSAKQAVRVKAKTSTSGSTATIQFYLADSDLDLAADGSSTYNINDAQASVIKTFTVTDVEQDFILDYSGDAEFASWVGNEGVDMYGIIFTAGAGVEVQVSELEFGYTVTANQNANVVNDQVSLFPNPAKSSFNVDMTAMNNSDAATIKVMNANGMIVKELSSNNSTEVVTTEGLNKGIYMVQVTSGNKIATKKVVVE
jgi:hypothetical protein